MIKKTIQFLDLDGNTVQRDFYFNLSQGELIRKNIRNMQLDESGEPDVEAFRAELERIMNTKSGRVIMDTFEDIIRESYGERDPDGITFNKSEELSRKFMNTGAYEVLFMEVITDAKKAGAFINGIMPANLGEGLDEKVDQLASLSAKQADRHVAFPEPQKSALGVPQDIANMSREELLALVADKTSRGGE